MKDFVWKKKCVNKNYIPNEMQIFDLIQLQKKDDNKKKRRNPMNRYFISYIDDYNGH